MKRKMTFKGEAIAAVKMLPLKNPPLTDKVHLQRTDSNLYKQISDLRRCESVTGSAEH